MKTVIAAALGMTLLAGCAQDDMAMEQEKAAMENEAHGHIGHVMTGWADTPEQWGFLPTAIEEAKIVAQHAGYADSKPGDLEYMQTHIRHVIHALEPSVIAEGPGHGYGVVTAAWNAAKHIGLAAESTGTTENIKLHTEHVWASADKVVTWAKAAVALSQEVLAASSAADAAPMVKKIKAMSDALIVGIDADGDGNVTWKKGEGGLDIAEAHMGYMMEGENL